MGRQDTEDTEGAFWKLPIYKIGTQAHREVRTRETCWLPCCSPGDSQASFLLYTKLLVLNPRFLTSCFCFVVFPDQTPHPQSTVTCVFQMSCT